MTNEPKLSRIKTLSPVWFIPLLALIIAVWLALRAWQATGPVIEIEFNNSAGIAVGKTHVRYRNVEVGEVKDIRLSDDFTTVRVLVEMDPQVSSLLTDQVNFWVVSPSISLNGVTGIDTLLSGVYIEMDSAGDDDSETQSNFVGLEEQPSVRSYDQGGSYKLIAETLGSLNIGSPIYYRQIPVGEITGYKLLPEDDKVQLRFFIKAPYNELVKERSQFWNISGFDVDVGLDGVNLDVGSLTSLIAGGVEFETPSMLNTDTVVAEPNSEFYLFADRDSISEGAFTVSYPFLLRFSGSVRGLKIGAPVEYLGIQVGEISHIAFDNDLAKGRRINVLIGIQPERLDNGELLTKEIVQREMANLVRDGLQAKLHSGSLVGGSLFVDLVPEAVDKGELLTAGRFPEIPTSENEYSQIARQVKSIVERVHSLPIEDIGKDLEDSLKAMRAFVSDLQQGDLVSKTSGVLDNLKKVSEGLDSTFDQLEQTLRSVDQTVAPDSTLSYTLTKTLKDISDASKSMEQLTDELYRYPDSLLRGKEADK